MSKKVKKTLTEKRYKRWTVVDTSLKIGQYAIPVGTMSIYAGVNCQKWIEQSNAFSIGMGWAMFILAAILTVFGLTKYDDYLSKKISKMYFFGFVLLIIGAAALFFAKVYEAFGYMMLCTGGGLVGGGLSSTTEKTLTAKKVDRYNKALEGLGILKEEKKVDAIHEQAVKDAEIIKERERIPYE